MTVSEALAALVDDTVESSALVPHNGFHLEPRCRICRNDQARKKVNAMLACGGSYAQIVRSLGEDNARLDKRDQVTVDSVRTHTTKHFPVQQTAHATYREILERRAQENRIDFINGVATALTPLAFFEVVMAKAFRSLVDDRTEVSVETGLRAAEKLQSVLDGRDQGADIARMRVDLGRIIAAVKSTVPQEMWGEISGKLDRPELEHSVPFDEDADDFEEEDDVFDPGDFTEEDDEF
jgi:hypothetical protein